MGRFTGDHNGIHLSDRYARAFGFRCALYHPPVVLGHCLARLASFGSGRVTRLAAWLKEPVYKGSVVTLRAEPAHGGSPLAFALSVESDVRPALIGRIGWDRHPDIAGYSEQPPATGGPF